MPSLNLGEALLGTQLRGYIGEGPRTIGYGRVLESLPATNT